MRVNWFSPLPPARTGIAQYTVDLLPMLCDVAEVTLWTDQREWDRQVDAYTSVRWFDPDHLRPEEINRADVSFYNLGNDARFHLGIWQVARNHPGMVILHDLRLFDFFAYTYREAWRDRDGFLGEIQRFYGAQARNDAERWWDGRLPTAYMVQRCPLTPLALENALGAVVHAPDAVRFTGAAHERLPDYFPLPYPASVRGMASARLRQRGVTSPFRLIIFGYIHPNRRLDSVLQALAGFPERDRLVLDVYGELWNTDHVTSQIRSLGLDDRVTLHGFVSEVELDAALDAADLALNLRYPTMGEASLSQLQIWDHALPSLVSPVGWYASLPTSAVGFVRPDHEIEDLQVWFSALLSKPERFAAMGENGRRILEQQHDPKPYVERLIDIAAGARAVRRNTAAMQLAARVGFEMGAWCDPQHADVHYRRIAERIRPVLT